MIVSSTPISAQEGATLCLPRLLPATESAGDTGRYRCDQLVLPVHEAGGQALGPAQVSPGRAAALSAIIPGGGQRMLGQQRWIAYVAVETWAWVQFIDWRRKGGELRGEYRDLAWFVARRVSSGPRVDGDFEYYEAMLHHLASGAFDSDPLTDGIQPETDSETFNGKMWNLARDLFLPPDEPITSDSEAYRKALEYYGTRAYGAPFAWNWGSGGLQQSVYRELIRSSDENLRRSTTMVGLILANHLLSVVDALVSSRLRLEEGRPETLALLPHPWDRTPGGWALEFRIRY